MNFFEHRLGVTDSYCLKKVLRIMKLTFALILVLNLNVLANTYSQTKVSLDLKSADFKKVISEIEKKTVYRFVFGSKKIPVSKFRDIKINNEDALA